MFFIKAECIVVSGVEQNAVSPFVTTSSKYKRFVLFHQVLLYTRVLCLVLARYVCSLQLYLIYFASPAELA